jgi:putative SOS response-associated peptidase YedK
MCGRFTLEHSTEEIVEHYLVEEKLADFPPRYNISPGQPVAAVTQNAFGDGKRVLEGLKWGLVPSWAKDASIGNKMINARMETLLEKPAFKRALARRRCLLPADGFYEWTGTGKAKQPVHIRFRDRRLFSFAGLWEEWESPDGSPLRSCTIITGLPNPLLSTLHHRMAVILPPELENIWLDPKLGAEEAWQLLQIFPDDELEAFPVNRKVGNVAFDDPSCILPLEAEATSEEEESGGQLSLL